MEPVTGTPRRGLLAASVVTLVTLPVLVLSNLGPPPASIGVPTRGTIARVLTVSTVPAPSPESDVVIDPTTTTTTSTTTTTTTPGPQPRQLAPDVVDPVVAVETEAEEATTTTAPPATVPPTTAAPTTAAPTTAPPTTAAPTTAAPTTAPPTTAPPTTVPPTTVPPPSGGGSIFGHPYDPAWPTLSMWDRMAICEAGGNWSIDTGNGYYGGLQFSQGSWEWVGGSGNPAHAPREEQIYRGNLLWEKNGWNSWPGCKRKLGWGQWQTRS